MLLMHRVGVLSLLATSAFAASADPSIERRIHRIEADVLPPVLIAGESRTTSTLAERMAALKVPGISVALIHAGKVQWARGYGVAEVGGAAVTKDTLFQAASISKPVTALAALRLVQLGKLDLDTDVNHYLKSWKIPANRFTDQTKVTLRQLLSHSAGLTVHGFAGYGADVSRPTLIQILDGTPPANSPAIVVDMLPGTQFRYSGGGYVVVQQLLQDVSGEPFADFMQRMVLKPLGMSLSTYEQPLPAQRMTEAARAYEEDGTPILEGPHVYPEQAPAGLWTTPTDLARYALEVQRALKGESHLLSPSMARTMLTPGLDNQGLGPHINGDAKNPYFQHGGANAGYRCELMAYEAGDGVVAMTNSDNGSDLATELIRTIANEYGWPDYGPPLRQLGRIDPARFDLLAGSYQLNSHAVVTFTRLSGHFYYQATGQRRAEIYPESEQDFFATSEDIRMSFKTDGQGRAVQMIWHRYGHDVTAERLEGTAAEQVAQSLAILNKRIEANVPAPGGEATVRRVMAELAAGKPDYDRMSPEFAALTREVLQQVRKILLPLGAVQSVSFEGIHDDGADMYRVVCEHGAVRWGIVLTADGKLDQARFEPTK